MDWITLIAEGLKAYNKTLDKADILIAYFKKAEDAGWFEKTTNDFKPLSGPTTKEQKDEAAKAIADDIHNL